MNNELKPQEESIAAMPMPMVHDIVILNTLSFILTGFAKDHIGEYKDKLKEELTTFVNKQINDELNKLKKDHVVCNSTGIKARSIDILNGFLDKIFEASLNREDDDEE